MAGMLVRGDKDRLAHGLCFVMSSSVVTLLKVSCDSKGERLEGAGSSVRGISMSDDEYVRLGHSGPAIALQSKLESRCEVK